MGSTIRKLTGHGVLPIGVDVRAGSVRLLQLRRSRSGWSVVGAEEVCGLPATEGLSNERVFVQAMEAVGKCFERGRFIGRKCVVSVEDRLLRVRSIRQPRMSGEETDRAIVLEGQGRLGFKDELETEIGWIRAGEVRQGDDQRDELIMIGIERPPVERLVDALVDCGLRPMAVEPVFLASARAYSQKHRRASDTDTTRMLVDVHHEGASVVVLRGERVVLFKYFETGGAALTKLASVHLGLGEEAVSELRQQRIRHIDGDAADALDEKVGRAIYDTVRPIMEGLANEVSLCLRYATVTFRGPRPDSLVLVGEDSYEPGLLEAFGKATGLEATYGRPFDGIDIPGASVPLDRRRGMSEWSSVVGLSMRGEASSRSARNDQEKTAPAEREAA